jgi:hypothetical protein
MKVRKFLCMWAIRIQMVRAVWTSVKIGMMELVNMVPSYTEYLA